MSSSEPIDPTIPVAKLISFALPCYNAAAYLDHCVESILTGAEGYEGAVEIILVDDGSTADDTAAKIDAWQERHPGTIRAIHQENAGHGGAVNTGLAHAQGAWFKVVDSDDWLDKDALHELLSKLSGFRQEGAVLDLIIVNYVYEKVEEGKRVPIRFAGALPEGRSFGWDEVGNFKPQQNLLMHAVVYRTKLLRETGLQLPQKTFYVDNIFVYVPLPAVERLFYLNIDLYRYFIGREGQSVAESTMVARVDQQLRITGIMIDAYHLEEDVKNKRLRTYMRHYLAMMMTICSIFLRLSTREDAQEQEKAIWEHLRQADPCTYKRIRRSPVCMGSTLPGKAGKAASIAAYHLAQRLFNFN
ncbi:MAG: glycosyltransferase [Coriobacteriales bacterium]|jgi:glycosyltransferase involved in cell wall biosynthesis|nr:glycosyltransferase [Coriobacteriales bacterium]